MRRLSIALAITAIGMAALGTAAAAETLKTCPKSNHVGDVRVTGTCIIPSGITVDGDLLVKNGTLRLRGTVTGNVIQKDKDGGRGHVYVSKGGHVGGSITERHKGRLQVEDDATVGGSVTELHAGHLNIFDNAVVADWIFSPREAASANEPGKKYCKVHATASVGERYGGCVPGFYDV